MTITANNTTASAASDLSIDVVFDAVPINAPATIVVTFPVGWTVPTSADLTAVGVSWAGLQDFTPTITSNAGARTISTTIAVNQMLNGPAPAITLTIPNTSGLVNPAAAASYNITVDAPGSAQGTGAVNITGGAPAVTGGSVTLNSTTVGANTAGTIAFTLGGALATGNSIVLTFPASWTVFNGAMTAGNWTGLNGAPTSVTGNAAARTVTIVIGATAQTTTNVTLTIDGSTQLVNRTTPAVGVSIGIAATGQTAGTSNVFNIVAGAPSAYTLTGPAAVNAGVASTNFTITIQDAFGNTVNTTQNTTFTLASTAAGTVTFNPASPVTVTTGTSSVTFTYTATQAGSKTITATRASGDAVGGPQTASITVNAGAASKLQLLVPGETAAAGSGTGKTGTPSAQTTGAAFSVTVNMVDANWNVVTSTDTVGITSTDGGATLPANAALVAGTKTFNVTLNTVSTPTITATDITNGARTASTSPAITVAAPPPPPEDPGTGGSAGPPIVIPVACGQNQVSDGNGGCSCVVGYILVGINCVPAAQCPPGSFSTTGAAPCTPAAPGKYVSTAGATQAIDCPAGSYSDTAGAVACTQAPAGRFVPRSGATEAFSCPEGQTSAVGATSCFGAITGAAVTLSSATANATNVTTTITFDTLVAIPSGGKIKVTLPGFAWPSIPTATFTAPSALANTMSFAGSVLTVTLPGGAPAGAVTFDVTGATLPEAQAALTTVRFEVTSGADTVLASTSSGTLVAIAAGPEIRLVFTTPPPANTMGAPFTVEVTAQDERGQTMPVTGTASLLLFNTSQCTPGSTGFCIVAQSYGATFVDGVATFSEITLTEQTISRGRYFFRARHAPAGQPVLQAESAEFNVLPKLTLVFTTLPSTTGVVGQPLAQQPVVEVRDSANNRVTTGSYRVSFAGTTGSGQGPFPNGSATATTVEGIARFTNLTFSHVDTYVLAADAEVATGLFISTDPAPAITVTAAARATKLVFVTPLPKFTAGQKSIVQVRATDSDGLVVTGYAGSLHLAFSGIATGAGMLPRTPSFVNGVATVLDVTPRRAGGLTMTATTVGTTTLLTSATTSVTVAEDTAVSYIAFSKQPTYEVTGVAFSIQPVVTAYTASGAVATGATGTVTLTASFAVVTAQTIRLAPTPTTATFVAGVATFSGLTASATADAKNVVLTATAGTLTATSTPFDVYLTAAAASTARAAEMSPASKVDLKFEYDSTLLDNPVSRLKITDGIKADTCFALGLTTAGCSSVSVTLAKSLTVAGARVPTQAAVTGGITELRELNVNLTEARLGRSPRGTGLIATYSMFARDQDGLLLPAPPTGLLSLTFVVGVDDVPAGTPAGDLRAAAWDSKSQRWRYVPTRVVQTQEGGYQVIATTTKYGVYAVVYAPGAGLISGFSGFGPAGGLGFGVFAGGPSATLATITELQEGDGVWVQDARGEFRVLSVGGPDFMRRAFDEAFPDGIASSTPVLLVQNRR